MLKALLSLSAVLLSFPMIAYGEGRACTQRDIVLYSGIDGNSDGDIHPVDILILNNLFNSTLGAGKKPTPEQVAQADVNMDKALTPADFVIARNAAMTILNGRLPCAIEVLRAGSILDAMDVKNLAVSDQVVLNLLALESVPSSKLDVLSRRFDFDRNGRVDADDIRAAMTAIRLFQGK